MKNTTALNGWIKREVAILETRCGYGTHCLQSRLKKREKTQNLTPRFKVYKDSLKINFQRFEVNCVRYKRPGFSLSLFFQFFSVFNTTNVGEMYEARLKHGTWCGPMICISITVIISFIAITVIFYGSWERRVRETLHDDYYWHLSPQVMLQVESQGEVTLHDAYRRQNASKSLDLTNVRASPESKDWQGNPQTLSVLSDTKSWGVKSGGLRGQAGVSLLWRNFPLAASSTSLKKQTMENERPKMRRNEKNPAILFDICINPKR